MKLIDDLISVFPSNEEDRIRLLVERTQEFEIYPNRNQIWASILILSDATTEAVVEILPHAKKDWRNVIVAAGLAVDDWELLAKKWASKKAIFSDRIPPVHGD
jgi:hypothetical protein